MTTRRVERFDAARHAGFAACAKGEGTCQSAWVVMQEGKPQAGYCRLHMAEELNAHASLRHAVIFQMMEKVL